jgi:hypothetical protein
MKHDKPSDWIMEHVPAKLDTPLSSGPIDLAKVSPKWTLVGPETVYIEHPGIGNCYVSTILPIDARLIADAPRLTEENERLRALLSMMLDAWHGRRRDGFESLPWIEVEAALAGREEEK